MKFPERNKRPGVFYAVTRGGLELPVIDVTHPAFALNVEQAEQQALIEKFIHEGVPFASLPRLLRNWILQVLLRGSVLAQGIRHAQGGFMTGLHTYLLKLGPKMLGGAYAKAVDYKIAASLPALSVRLRLQDVAQLLAETLQPALVIEPNRPVTFVNIAGGPAIDSLNALILLHKRQPELLSKRLVSVDVLDLDGEGPALGSAALTVLAAESGALHGLHIDFRHTHYDWSQTEELEQILNLARKREAIVICSSEGGLFEYGTDEDIKANLKVLRSFPEVLAVIGSVTRADEPMRRLRQSNPMPTRPRGLCVFRELAQGGGWQVARAIERPFSDQVVLTASQG
jgi:hypothetical protein